MDVGISGFRVQGSWERVVEHAERVSRALLRALADRDEEASARENQAVGEWEEWRPRREDETEADVEEQVRERTVEQASLGENEAEEEGVGVREDLADAGRKMTEASDQVKDGGLGEAAESVGESVGHTTRAADQAARRALRAVEEGLYRHLVTRISPYYFDNLLVHANLERVGDDEFVFEVNVKDDDLKPLVAEELEAMHAEDEGEPGAKE